jgi:hypothetical protein
MTDTVRRFRVEIVGPEGKEVDTAWESWSMTELSDACDPSGVSRGRSVEITLRGPLTSGRKALCTWINDTTQGRPWKRTLTIVETVESSDGLSIERSYDFFECWPCRWKAPELNANSDTALRGKVTVRGWNPDVKT